MTVIVETAEHVSLGDAEDEDRDRRVCHLGEGTALCGAQSGLVMSLRAARRPTAPRCELCGTTRCSACVERLIA